VNQLTGLKRREDSNQIMITQDGFLAHKVYKTNKCLNHINAMHMSNVISKRVNPSSRNAHRRGLNTHERMFETM